MKPVLENAIALANLYHMDQKDKIGEPYILHPIRVMLSLNNPNERIVAILHDIIEDTKCTFDILKVLKYDKQIINAIDCLTKRDGESYEVYLKRVVSNKLAINVKRADISDNMSPIRLYKLEPEKRIKLREKYTKALNILDKLENNNV